MFENRVVPTEQLKAVSRYMTPYAVLLVVMGLVFGHPPAMEARLTIGILILSLVINIGAVMILQKAPERGSLIRDMRVGINIVCNFSLIYLLLPYWPEIWMLLLLVIIALSVYDTWYNTLFYCCAFSAGLLVICYLKGFSQGLRLGQSLMYAATLVFVGVFINRLVGIIRSVSSNPAG